MARSATDGWFAGQVYCRVLLMVLATHTQLAGPRQAMLVHLPGFLSVVVQAALVQPLSLSVLTHGPAATRPARCRRPGKPVSVEHVPAWLTAVKTVNIRIATITSSSGRRKATLAG